MRILSSMTFRAIAGSVGAAALVLTLASISGHRAPAATPHTTELAFGGSMHCSPWVCGG